ncbi:MAG TPA: DUF3160 domain-containing protein [Acidimicrobiia bacterium]|nr:DUF3160 domain-containing protein [Acidimicrobiia bacterium]
MVRSLRSLLVVALVATACSPDEATITTTSTAPTTTTTSTAPTTTGAVTTTPPTTTVPLGPPSGLALSGLDLSLPAVALLERGMCCWPDWPSSLAGVAYADAVPAALTERLTDDGFAIDGTETHRHLAFLYAALYPYNGRPVFVTTDAAYHHWHLVFDRILREVETGSLLPVLERFTMSMVEATRSQAAGLADTEVAEPAQRAAEFFEAVATVLGLDVGPVGDRARDEIDLVLEHAARTGSPTLGGDCDLYSGSCVDYSLTTPRGHYTRSEDLTRYFRAMSLLGNGAAAIADADAMRVSLLIARMLTTDEQRAADWATIYYPTAFLVGTADDYTPFEAAVAATAVAPEWLTDPAVLDDAVMSGIATDLAETRPVFIGPESASLRTMGTRFVFDSWVFDGLVLPSVPDRTRVSALDLAAVFGSDWALARQDDAGETALSGYLDAVAAMRTVTSERTMEDWGASVYGAWLYALQPMWMPHGEGYPPFMQSDAWTAKAHQTGFGSYTELKHDTILYAKQGMAEGDMEVPPVVSHWVEPDPVAFHRIANAARLLRDGLVQMDLLPGSVDEPWTPLGILEALISVVDRLAVIATSELAGNPISAEDNEFLGQIGGWFESLLYSSAGDLGMIDDHGGLVADIFLDAVADEVLEVGTADFNPIYVIVPDGAGGFEVATGGVYAYHEFWHPRSDRLTDEAWWQWIEEGTLPDRPFWVTDFLGL